jgi:hypothetical protein
MVLLGVALMILSCLYVSSFLAIISVTLIFWGAILFYVKPAKYVPFSFVTATSNSSTDNINKVLSEINVVQKGYYLPPKSIQDTKFSLLFIPKYPIRSLPAINEITSNSLVPKKDGLLLTPPGYDFSMLMEQKLGQSFSEIDLNTLVKQLPKLLVDELEIAENVELHAKEGFLTVEIRGSFFIDECNQTKRYPNVHTTAGCLLSSSLACVLAKVTGKAVTIKSEETVNKTMTFEYQIIGE